jgi:hypothetical protein
MYSVRAVHTAIRDKIKAKGYAIGVTHLQTRTADLKLDDITQF